MTRLKTQRLTRENAEALFRLAGFTVSRTWELANLYWPDAPDYDDVREPWWLVLTEIGPVQIGWRKSVISIAWDATKVRGLVTNDEVTQGDDHVHAWGNEKALEYLTALRRLA